MLTNIAKFHQWLTLYNRGTEVLERNIKGYWDGKLLGLARPTKRENVMISNNNQ